ncbi:MAG TPA: S-layer homology domain-containing protein, partial [Oscillospiraceae bacterium]|nr:S-layer homology domain-containing protein [Oscillospiraceae bacterium]
SIEEVTVDGQKCDYKILESKDKISITAIFDKAKDYHIVVKALGYKDAEVIQKMMKKIEEENEADEDNKNFIITQETIQNIDNDIVVKIEENVKDVVINISQILSGDEEDDSIVIAKLPGLSIETKTEGDNLIKMSIPKGVKVKAPAKWDGMLNLPEKKSIENVEVEPDAGKKARVNVVIEVGAGDDVILNFDRAVRLVIPGQAGKDVGYIRKGVFKKIDTKLKENNQETGDSLEAGAEGWINVGDDLVIWTKHFTKFVTYIQETIENGGDNGEHHDSGSGEGGGGGGGGGSSKITEAIIMPNSGGILKEYGVIIDFPANAVDTSVKLSIKKSSSTEMPENATLLSSIYDIIPDKFVSFKKPFIITIPFDKKKAEGNDKNILIYWLNDKTNKWIEIEDTQVDLTKEKAVANAQNLGKFAVMRIEEVKKEKDAVKLKDIKGHWAEEYIAEMVENEILTGYPDGTFRPDTTVTRAEFVTILVKAFELEQKFDKVFEDTRTHWARAHISTTAAYEIITGYNENQFGPNDTITREQMAKMVAVIAKLDVSQNAKSFIDWNEISDWAKGHVSATVEHHIINGFPDNTFRPKAGATRAEAVKVISEALK